MIRSHTCIQRNCIFPFASILVLLTTVGCGGGSAYDGPPRVAVSGTITLDGAPLASGIIAFVPDDAGDRTVTIPVADGKYQVPEGKGPNKGTHLVVISGAPAQETLESEEESPAEEELPEDGAEPEPVTGLARFISPDNVIPPQFNAETTLTADTSAQSVFDFEVTSQ